MQMTDEVGEKFDGGKLRWCLLPWIAVTEVVHVLMYGSEKYADDNWKHVENAKERYFDAAMRHLLLWWDGETFDPETGRHHLAHATCCILFILWFELTHH